MGKKNTKLSELYKGAQLLLMMGQLAFDMKKKASFRSLKVKQRRAGYSFVEHAMISFRYVLQTFNPSMPADDISSISIPFVGPAKLIRNPV